MNFNFKKISRMLYQGVNMLLHDLSIPVIKLINVKIDLKMIVIHHFD